MASADTSALPIDLSGTSSAFKAASARCDTASSYSSEAYAPLPPGLWLFNLYGNCSRCHHHHRSAQFKVNVPRNPNVTTHVKCQGCNEKWLAIGGRNASQYSLLSVNTVRLDPAAAEVRHSLVQMVRAATALATLSPVLGRVPESSSLGPSCQRSYNEGIFGDSFPPVMNPEALAEPDDLGALQLQSPARLLMPATVRPTTGQKYGFMTGRRMSHLRESVGTRFPVFHRANLRSKLGSLTKSRLSAKQLGKQPLGNTALDALPTSNSQAPDTNVQYKRNDDEPLTTSLRCGAAFNDVLGSSSAAATRFLAPLKAEPTNLSNMTETERADWIRAKYTEFINSTFVSAADTARAASAAAESAIAAASSSGRRHRQSLDLAGVGGRQSPSDRSYSYRASFITVSDRISEAETAVGDDATTITSGPRSSFEQFLSGRPGSTRSRGLNAYTLRLLRLRRAELRRSGDSTVTIEATSSTSRPGSSISDHSSHGSTIRRQTLDELNSMEALSSYDSHS